MSVMSLFCQPRGLQSDFWVLRMPERFSGHAFVHQHETKPRPDALSETLCALTALAEHGHPVNNRPESRHPKTTVVVKQGSSCMNLEGLAGTVQSILGCRVMQGFRQVKA